MNSSGRAKKYLFLGLFLGIILGGFVLFGVALAAEPDLGMAQVQAGIGLPATDIRVIVANIIKVFLGLLGIIALVLIIYAGYLWMTAGGDDEKIGQAKKIIINATIGLAIILSAYAIVSFVMNKLIEATIGVPTHCTDGKLNEDEEKADCGGLSCQPCPCEGAGCSLLPVNSFYVDQLPAGGDVCIRNVKLAIVFNEAIDINTLPDNVIVKNALTNEVMRVQWSIGANNNVAIFTPTDSCAPADTGNDCLVPNTEYILDIIDANSKNIKNLSGTRSLSCGIKAGCKEIKFKTGDGVDRVGPTLSIFAVSPSESGVLLPVDVTYSDDNGVQNISLYANNNYITSQALSGCSKSGTVHLLWDTKNLTGSQSLKSTGLDWAANSGEATASVLLKPAKCYDVSGQPICGTADCGKCAGDKCTNDNECTSLYCENPPGVCVDRARITYVSPLSGATSTFVTVSGLYLGDTPGNVYFARTSTPDSKKITSDWVKANLATGCNMTTWSNHQVIVEVPNSAVTGPLMIETADITGADGKVRKFFDTTNDNWGQKIDNFVTDGKIRPSLCPIIPNNGLPAATTILNGKNFGNTLGQVFFGGLIANTSGANGTNGWSTNVILAKVPLLDKGAVGVNVKDASGVESNSVFYHVNAAIGENFPFISDITPQNPAAGDYVTITGNNFGNALGKVFFTKEGTSNQIEGKFDFPVGCGDVWHDNQIVVKFPTGITAGAKYFVQVQQASNTAKVSEKNGPFVTAAAGLPGPGICSISQTSGPVPLPNNFFIEIIGENFGDAATANAYFWKNGASANLIDGRVKAESYTFVSSGSAKVRPALGTQSGPLIIYRSDDKKISNPVSFSVYDCVKNGNVCNEVDNNNIQYQCCNSGNEAGVCKPASEKCSGQINSTGYIWRFSTKDIPVAPHVIERCDSQTELGIGFPSPSPSVLWNTAGAAKDHTEVCRGAMVLVEFNRDDIGQNTKDGDGVWNGITKNDLIVEECPGGIDNFNTMTCKTVTDKATSINVSVQDQNGDKAPYHVSPASQTATKGTSYLELKPAVGTWKDNTWYRVALKKSIVAGVGTNSEHLFADRPCDINNDGTIDPDSAYCFVFKTGQNDCKIRAVVIAPNNYWTKTLEAPIKKHTASEDGANLYYSGHGLSEQRCIIMDVSGFSWNWNTSDSYYSAIYSGGTTVDKVQVSALANTVGIGLKDPADAINIIAKVTTSSKTYTGSSPLTIDLSNPEVVSYEPNCLEACTNAQIAVKFNVSMSNKNLSSPAIRLLKCNDENCFSTTEQEINKIDFIDKDFSNTYIKITPLNDLVKQTLYEVVLSASTTITQTNLANNTNLLWSAAKFGDPTTFSKPYNKEFSWRFRTKKEACQVDRVEVKPTAYYAQSLFDRTVYMADMFSAPDACSAVGQKLDPWVVGWKWNSSNTDVAITTSFTTIGNSPYCTADCIRKGSDVPAVTGAAISNFPVCGNGKLEAGEDCDAPDAATGCGLNCLYMGNTVENGCGNKIVEKNKGEECDPADPATKVGCSVACLHTGSSLVTGASDVSASVCNNGTLGSGEDCDLGIAADYSVSGSAMSCTANCLHQGTRLSTKWCNDNKDGMGGFTTSSFNSFCKQAYSQCGDGVTNPDEDQICDSSNGWNSSLCDEFCLLKNGDDHSDNVVNNQCSETDNSAGCSAVKKQHVGSSLLYSNPSVCGDGVIGVGEDASCETGSGFTIYKANLVNPWVLASGIGNGQPDGTPLSQKADIKGDIDAATNNGKTKGNSGKFIIECGNQVDSDCKQSGYGVAANTCCYARSKLLNVFPGATTTDPNSNLKPESTNICPNTSIEAHFDGVISQASLSGNIFVARGLKGACGGALDVTDKVVSALEGADYKTWYQNIWQKMVKFFINIFGDVASAGVADHWCAFSGVGSAVVVPDAVGGGSKISIGLKQPLNTNTDFMVILGPNIKDDRGVRIGDLKNSAGKNVPIFWKFSTGGKICEVDSLQVIPDQYVFSRPGVTTTLWAQGKTSSGQTIQGIPGFYDWDIMWGPQVNDYVFLTATTSEFNTITSQNHDGEIDIRASASITANKYTAQTGLAATGRSHVIVFLCENPWPPKDLILNGNNEMIFPYEDKVGNNDGFDFTAGKFNNTSIPKAQVGSGYFNFSTYYCADNGSTGIYDDLPYMKPAVQVSSEITSASTSFKNFLFTGDKPYDNSAIAIKIFNNPDHLSVNQWLKNSQEFGGKNFTNIAVQNLKVDGYNAVSDGNNIYVDGLNFNFDTGSDTAGKLYNNIYLFSISENASAETRAVFDQMIKNLHFNANLTNYGYCGANMANPGVSDKCATDFDCKNGEICSAQTDKLKRDYERLLNLSSIEKSLQSYYLQNKKYPDLAEGSYLSGQTVSTWDSSWGLLGTILGAGALPVDPINRLGVAGSCSSSTGKFCLADEDCPVPETCVLHNAVDGWSTENNRFSFACNTSSLAFRYTFSSSTGYTVRGRFEDSGLIINNWLGDFFYQFIQMPSSAKDDRFIISPSFMHPNTGICFQNEEISTLQQGYCGDGKLNLNLGEKCDPPGFINYEAGCTGAGGSKSLQICKADCSGWTPSTTPCGTFSKCGNNVIEVGEICDQGDLNGTYNHCDAKNQGGCKSFGVDNSVGICGDGILQKDKEFCDTAPSSNGTLSCLFADPLPAGTPPYPVKTVKDFFYLFIDASHTMGKDKIGAITKIEYVKKQLLAAVNDLKNVKWGALYFNGNNVYKVLDVSIHHTASELQNLNIPIFGGSPVINGYNWFDNNILPNNTDPSFVKKIILITDGVDGLTHNIYSDPVGKAIDKMNKKSIPTFIYAVNNAIINYDDFQYLASFSPSNNSPVYNSKKAGVTGVTTDELGHYISTLKTKPGAVYCQNYSFYQANACKYDCSGPGSYCGDGVVDTDNEQCDGDAKCSIEGLEGIRKCNGCIKNNTGAVAAWNFDSSSFTDSVGSHNTTCVGTGCPSNIVGKYGKAVYFDGVGDNLTVKPDPVFSTSTFTVSVWVNPKENNQGYTGIFSKVKSDYKAGFSLQFDPLSFDSLAGNERKVHLVFYKPGLSNQLTSVAQIPFDDWTNISVTYDNTTAKMYINGKLDKSLDMSLSNSYDGLYVGQAPANNPDGYFKGSIDELSYYNRALSDLEIKDLYDTNWFCSTSIKVALPETKPEAGYCGDGETQPELNETCDNGSDNGKPCVAGYNQSCSYCTDVTCQVKIVNATGYCGDGIINGSEICDAHADSSGNKIINAFATSTGTYDTLAPGKWYIEGSTTAYEVKKCEVEKNTKINLGKLDNATNKIIGWTDFELKTFKKGTKSCINSCSELATDCVECGLSNSGVPVTGHLINVLEPRASVSSDQWMNPLYNDSKKKGAWSQNEVRLTYINFKKDDKDFDWDKYSVGWSQGAMSGFGLKPMPFGTGVDNALINSDARCSADDNGARYYLQFNADKQSAHAVPINITSAPTPGQYDQVLSPVMRLSDYNSTTDVFDNIKAAPRHLRIVLSWRGQNDLNAGFLLPEYTQPTIDDVWFSANNKWATSIKYYESDNKVQGIWYHGLSDTDAGLHVKAFTVDLDNMYLPIDVNIGKSAYGFYIKAPDLPIQSYFSNNVTVSVYIPEDENMVGDNSWRHFSRPIKTFDLNSATASGNPGAKYWHVFNIFDLDHLVPANIANFGNWASYPGLNSIRTDLKFSY